MSYLIEIPSFNESDGNLGAFEPDIIPGFQIKRVFLMFLLVKLGQIMRV